MNCSGSLRPLASPGLNAEGEPALCGRLLTSNEAGGGDIFEDLSESRLALCMRRSAAASVSSQCVRSAQNVRTGGGSGSLRPPRVSPAAAAAVQREEESWHGLLQQQLSQTIPAAGSLLLERGDKNAANAAAETPGGDSLDWASCHRALERLLAAERNKGDSCLLSSNLGVVSLPASSADGGLFDVPVEPPSTGYGKTAAAECLLEDNLSPPGDAAASEGEAVLSSSKRRSSSTAADPLKERRRRELQQKRTLDLAAQIISRFKGARRPGVLQLLHRFFSCSRQVRDPQELEKLVAACCYIIARQQGDDMSLNDVAAQLERRQGTRGRQRCRCISRWVVKVCGKVQLQSLPRRRDAETIASNALRRICCHLKLLLTQQEQQELLLLQNLKEAYRQCVQQEAAAAANSSSSSSKQQQQQQGKDTPLAELDDEDLLRLLLIQQQENAAAVSAAAAAAAESGGAAAAAAEGLADVEAFLQQFDTDCSANKVQVEDDAAAAAAGGSSELVSLGPGGSLQLRLSGGVGRGDRGERLPRLSPLSLEAVEASASPLGSDPTDPSIDAQIEQHECVLRLLRLLPSAQRIKLDHSIWLQKHRKLALQQLCEQSAVVIRCVGLLQQIAAVAFAAAAKQRGFSSQTEGTPGAEAEDPLDGNWRACGRCDAISTAAHFVIVFECLEIPVFQRVVLEALEVDRRSVYKRRRDHLHLILNIFRRLPGGESVTLKTLGAHLARAVSSAETSSALLQLAETEQFAVSSSGDTLDLGGPSEETQENSSSPRNCLLRSESVSRSSGEAVSPRGAAGGSSSPRLAAASPVSPVLLGGHTSSSTAAAAAALRDLEEADPVLLDTPMARVVSLQYERTQQRWVCKWREGIGTVGRWHRRCFSVVKYGEEGAHALAAAVAKKLRDKRNQETSGGGRQSSVTPTSETASAVEETPAAKRAAAGGSQQLGTSVSLQRPAKTRNKRNSPAAAAVAALSPARGGDRASSLSLFGTNSQPQLESLSSPIPADASLSALVASAAYSDEMKRLAQLLHKARNNPLLAKLLDKQAPPPAAAALRAAAESLFPCLSLELAADNKSTETRFSPEQQPPQRRGRVAGAREGM